MNFQWRVKTDTRLFRVQEHIKERHGRIADLKICKVLLAKHSLCNVYGGIITCHNMRANSSSIVVDMVLKYSCYHFRQPLQSVRHLVICVCVCFPPFFVFVFWM
jgi:hypothetical protein